MARRLERVRPVAVAAAVIAAVWAGAWQLWQTVHARQLDTAVANARNVVRGFESSTYHALHEVDNALRLLALRYADGGLPAVVAPIAEGLYNPGLVGHFAVFDAAGVRLYASGPDPAGRGDEEALLRLRRPLADREGRPAGELVAALDPRYFATLFDSAPAGENAVIALVGIDDGVVHVRRLRGGSVGVGLRIPESRLWDELLAAPQGVYRQVSEIDGRVRHVAYRQLKSFPLVALAAVAEADVAAAAGGFAINIAAVAALLTVLVVSTTAFIVAQRRAADRLAAALNLNREFLARVSHELRTPLNAILGFSEIVRDTALGRDAVDRYAEYARDIHDAGRHLLLLVDDVLDLSRLQAGTMELVQEPVDVRPVVEWGLRVVAPQAERKGLRIDARLEPGIGRLLADPRALRQMLLNLLSNAVKFTPAGGRITVEALRGPGGRCVLRVCDTGIGMTPEQVRSAALPFQQCSPLVARDGQGTGLGLAIVQALMEAHGGRLRIDSEPGAGSRVSLEFAA
ncbi:sensor histidine kinase [Azospirillum sp. ST 5-10]|uniref:sensor histidine kinase n=1 Tax=unclassified Azospirillum TaxID=2630922 RepID=UPI003F4A3224